MSTPQEYWDACLIRGFRNFSTVLDVLIMYKSITGDFPKDLLRVPPMYLNKTGIRVFMANRLPKINDWLHDHEPSQDVVLLRKLKNSKYDITDENVVRDMELQKERKHDRTNRKQLENNAVLYSKRNQATDWNVNKGPSRIRRSR